MNTNENEQISSLIRELDLSRERYQKLLNIHNQLQNQNCLLEERILSLADTFTNEKNQLEANLLETKQENLHLKQLVDKLETENQRYKHDCQLAVGLLQQYPNEFISKSSDNNNNNNYHHDKIDTGLTNSVIIPTFPPVFVPPPSIILPITQSLPVTHHQCPTTYYLCSKCHQLTNHSDASVQTSFDIKEYPKKLLPDISIPQMHHV